MRKRLKINQFLYGFIFFIVGALTVSILSVSPGGESSSFLEIEKRLIFNSIDLLPEEKNDPWIMGSNLYYIAHRGQIVQHAIDPNLPKDPHYNYSFLYNSMKDNKEVLMLMVNRFDPKDLTLLSLDKIGIRMENFFQRINE